MSIVVTSTENTKTQAPAEKASGSAEESKVDTKPSADAQGEELEAKEASQEEVTEDTGEESAPAAEEKPKKKSGIQRLKERHAREMAAVHRRIEELEMQAPKSQQKADDSKTEGKPKSEDFETHAEFVEALTEWKVDQREAKKEAESRIAKARSEANERIKSYSEKLETFKETVDDWEEVMEEVSDIKINLALRDLVEEAGPEIAYALAKDPAALKKMNALGPLATAKEFGKFEDAYLKAKESKPTPKETKTKAPAPLKPVGGGGGSVIKKSIYDPNISQAEYESIRREQMKKSSAWG